MTKGLLFFPFSALVLFLGTVLSPATATAGERTGYQTRVLHSCQHCRQPVYAQYRPVKYVNRSAVYGWVPVYHNRCSQRTSSVSTNRYFGASPRSSIRIYSSTPRYYSSTPRYYSSTPRYYSGSFSSPSQRYSRSYSRSRCR